jgi:hypothetical protein
MTLFSAAAAAALERSGDGHRPGIYAYPTELEFTAKTNGKYAPAIVVKILAKIVLDEPDVVFVAGNGSRIMVDTFPQSKPEFDEAFCTSTSGDKLSCKFEIQSSRHSFHAIKIGVWDILKEAQVWLKKSPGPVQKTPLTAIGFWMNIHPGFASARVFHSQLLHDIETQYHKHPELISKYQLPTEMTPIDMYLCRRKINADYALQDIPQPISTDALMVYVPKGQTDLAMIYLTQLSSLNKPSSPCAPMFIPLLAKYHTPGKFGKYVARHNCFLNDHRNIAIVGIVPEAMDTDNIAGDNLWESISSLPGVYRCDPCRRTPDLGKWNISCAKASHQSICDWIDENLVTFWSTLPDIDDFPKVSTFPTPERLSKGRRVSSGGASVASGLTNASPIDDYFRQLERRLPPQEIPANPTRHAWKNNLPIGDISYSFNTAEFPKLFDSDKSLSPTLATSPVTGSITHGATAVSAITETMVSNTVKSSITEFEKRRKVTDAVFDARMARLELQVGDISTQVSQMATQMQRAVIDTLTADDGIIARQHHLILRQDTKIDRMESVIGQLAESIQDLLHRDRTREHSTPTVTTLVRSPRERDTPSATHPSDACPSPDRSRQRLNNGAPTEGGNGAHVE